MKTFVYQWIHVTRGMCGVARQRWACSAAFMRAMRKWNRMGRGEWVYRLVGVDDS